MSDDGLASKRMLCDLMLLRYPALATMPFDNPSKAFSPELLENSPFAREKPELDIPTACTSDRYENLPEQWVAMTNIEWDEQVSAYMGSLLARSEEGLRGTVAGQMIEDGYYDRARSALRKVDRSIPKRFLTPGKLVSAADALRLIA